jgi:hypothetical protein
MALKFRRGTTAQKSGSLAFGEPYVNTTLGTLQIGGASGDITLLINSSSQGISGSSLDITGNAKIDGNLTLGGNITIGDNTSDTVTVTANLSSSLVPSITNTFDLGSSDKIWRDLYLSTGSIKLVDGNGNIVNTITNENIVTTDTISSGSVDLASSLPTGTVSGSSQITLQSTTGFTSFNTVLSTITGSLISSASADRVSITNINTTTASLNTSVSNINSFTSSINTTIKSKLDTDGVISGSSQITLSSTTGFTSYSSSVDSRILTEKGRVDAILSASTADADTFAEIVSLINSVDTTNDNAFATFYTSSVNRLNNLESTSASVETRLTQIGVITGSLIATASNHEQRLDTFESISGSFAKTNETNTFSNNQIVSGNIELTGRLTAGLAVSASGLNINKADGNVQIELSNSTTGRGFHLISYNGDSFSIHNPQTGQSAFRIDSGSQYHTHLFGDLYVQSGSIIAQNGITGSIAATNGVVSGSSQVTLQSTTGFSVYDTALSTITGSLIVSASTAKTTNDSQDVSISNLNSFSSSQLSKDSTLQTYTSSVENRLTEIGVVTGSLISSASAAEIANTNQNIFTASANISITNLNSTTASLLIETNNLELFSASVLTKLTEIGVVSGSLIATASNHEQRLDAMESESGSYARTNSANIFNGNQTITGSMYVSGDLIVQGSSSLQNISASAVDIGTNIIYLNTDTPAVRFAGISVFDSGSTDGTGSIFWDSENERWIYQKASGSSYSGGMFISGPRNNGALGSEVGMSNNRLAMGIGGDHISSSQVYVDNDTVAIPGNLQVTGSISAPQFVTLGNYTASVENRFNTLATLTGSNSVKFTNLESFSSSTLTRLTTLEVETSNLESFTSSINTTIKTKLDAEGVISSSAQLTTTFDSRYLNTGGDGVFSGSSQIPNSSITNAQLANNYVGIVGTAVTLGTTISAATIGNAIGAFSGSSQVDLTATTNYASGILTRLNAVGVVSGSSQIAFSGVTGTVSNAQLANSTISGISLGSNLAALTIGTGLSGTSYNGSGVVTITNTGVLSNAAGSGISVSGATGAVTITNSGVRSIAAGTGVSVSATTGDNCSISIGQSVATSASPTFAGLTINGAITATGDITAYFTSDKRHKNSIQIIPNALQKVSKLNGVTWEWNDDVNEVTKSTPKTGLIAQEVQEVLPEVVREREDGFLSLDYSKMMGLLVEAIKEQQTHIHNLTLQIEELKKQKGL